MKRLFIALLVLMMTLPGPLAGAAEGTDAPMGYAFLKPIYDAQGQFAFSPSSLWTALSMAAEGAQGDTRSQLLGVLGVDEPQPLDLSAYTQLKTANAAVVSADAGLLDSYQSLLLNRYQAQMMPMAEDVLSQVNAWVAEHTDGLIPEFLSAEPNADLKLMLLSALALDAKWAVPFQGALTEEGAFHAPEGDVTVPYMHASYGFEYAEAEGCQAVKLPYEGDQLEMVVVLPEAGGLQTLLERMAGQGIDWLGAFARRGEVRLSLPKLAMQSEIQLKPALQQMGVQDAFSNAADFSGMDGRTDLYVDEVLQKLRLDVDEEGTRAAAATGVMMASKALITDRVEMAVDRPYALLIQDREAGALLFAAVITNPTP